jgi:phosphoadenosine phosphosulfate reductase
MTAVNLGLACARRSVAELRVLAERGAADLGEASAAEVLDWVAQHFGRAEVAVTSSMADGVLPHLVSQHVPGVDVLFLDTGYHFDETLATRDEVADTLDVRVRSLTAETTVAEQDARFGPRLHDRDPDLCCAMRKVAPLRSALARYEVWITGVMREESAGRADTPLIAWNEKHGVVKVNPMAAWTADERFEYADREFVPVNALLGQGYPSIGCAPCTRAVAPGDDPRSGRWAGLAKTECGIHL